MRILLIQYKMLGDVLTSTIIADQLKITYPNCQIDYLITPMAASLVKNHPSVDNLILASNKDFESFTSILKLAKKLKKNNYQLCIDSYGKNNSALLSYIVNATRRIGYKKWFSSLAYTDVVKNEPNRGIYKTGVALGSRMILLKPLEKNIQWHVKPKIHLTVDEIEQGKQWLEQKGLDLTNSVTMISALGSSKEKTLPFKELASLLDFIVQNTETQILFNYIPNQIDQIKELYELCSLKTKEHIFLDAFAPNIRDFLKILHHCTAIIGNEGGAINMGKALDINTFAIFAPWINKSSWNIGEDGKNHVSVHLMDYKPDLYNNQSASTFKKKALSLYSHFEAGMIQKDLKSFLNHHY
ncbi:glycosyltransferase family 9 protein [Nonlabens tegetincola]|uniref:glycosyltransferase family 9 protein n=1 Tax=Nonlabens tegetincola TaxID=323273 RepID=UPI000D4DE4FE|nr:glycosyltransferase family 9 protein [Nonlabens tegetincola]PQJ14218.1 ADP-heptose--LPS heptosyltransferase [Nonlabens tegetincola]